MLHWSLLNEIYSFCILFILFIRYYLYERNTAQTIQRRIFVRCLCGGMGFIVLNIICVLALEHSDVVPRWSNIGLNTLYFFASIVLCSTYAYLLFDAMLAHVYDKHCLRRARIMLLTVTSLAVALILANLFTGMIFTVDANGVYQRGPLNSIFYFLPLTEIFFLCICYFRNRRSVGDQMIYLIKSLPLILLLICGLQLLYPDVLLNGTVCAVTSLMIFLAFRSSTEDHDALTGVNSRRAFLGELALRTGAGQSVQMISVSLLNLSDLNTRYAHTVGDALLYEVAQFLRRSSREADVYRTGGATFVLLLPLGEDAEADRLLSVIESRMASPWQIGEVSCILKIALAELRCRDLNDSPEMIVEQLEYTIAQAKGADVPIRFDDAIRAQMEDRTRLLALIRRSIDEGRFSVHYQPLYCCHKDIFCSAEALLRLSDEEGRPISPERFIPLAEENGLIEALTDIVLDDICRRFASETLPELQSVSINLSMRQLLDPELPAMIRARLDRDGIPPARIKVEITERFLLHDAAYARRQLEALQTLGIEVYMDDFGTGYSNLANVLQFPFSFIKLDRSLITPIVENKQATAMVSALIELFGNMDKRVVAEGVETAEQAALLRAMGIDMIQGYHYARPMLGEHLTAYFGK